MDRDGSTNRKNVQKKKQFHSLSTTDTKKTDLGFVREDESIQSLNLGAKNVDKHELNKKRNVQKKKPFIHPSVLPVKVWDSSEKMNPSNLYAQK